MSADDPDPGCHFNADPCGSGSEKLDETMEKKYLTI